MTPLPAFFRHGTAPAKVVRTAGGRVTTYRLDAGTGGWEERPELISGPAQHTVGRDEFLTEVERERGRLHGTGPAFDLYARITAVERAARAEDRSLTDDERETVLALRKRSYVLFETELLRRGDPGADPSLAVTPAMDNPRLRAEISMTALHLQLTPILQAVATDPAGAALRELRPRQEDYATTFVPAAAHQARDRYDALWDAGLDFQRPVGRTRITIHLAPAGALTDDNALSHPFPGGYRSVAGLLTPTRVWAAWRYLAPGSTAGLAYDGLTWCDDHWAFFPKPYRVLTAH